MKIQYYSHLLLYNKHYLKYKLIITLVIYILFFNKDIVFCMNQGSPESPSQTISGPEDLVEYIRNLECQNSRFNDRITTLERELRHNISLRYSESARYESLLRVAVGEIQELRENLHNSSQALAETNRVVNRLVQENTLLLNIVNQEQSDYTTNLDSNSDNSQI